MIKTVLAILVAIISLTHNPAWAEDNQSQQLCLDSSVVQDAAKSDGITDSANPDKFAKSLTSKNNFLDFCRGAKLTNGAQVQEGSCNPTPMGFIPSVSNMPSVRIIEPSPDKVIPAKTDFDIVISPRKISFGFFTSPSNTYYVAPQQLDSKGVIKGHTHVVIQEVNGKRAFKTEQVTFFKGISDKIVNGKVSTTVTGGLPAGLYRIATITSAMNHQPVALPIAKRGSVDDAIYVRVGSAGGSGSSTSTTTNSIKSLDDASNQEHKSGKKKKKSKKACRAKKRKA
ncbi:hypothetical protein PCASD_03318 [Puccinia coronata f. sp. avenae]|uniref:Uncharacterized protein n=1 Tax=Puccinia coronata f. sp. avenae TaxID=200324 RepID=A0A2N5VDY8_9BASI|nr:hypothetical protein PCASD_03318 [Puccinia coronata f. sp. avenae]